MFPAFWCLRKYDSKTKRVFRAPFEDKVLSVALVLPVIELVLAIVATIVPLGTSVEELAKFPMLLSVIVLSAIGEGVRLYSKRRRGSDYPGAAER